MLIRHLGDLQSTVVAETQEVIDDAQTHMTELIQDVFRGYKVEFDAKPEEDLSSCISFFKPGAVLKMGPNNGHMTEAERQGSGARRTLMWAALKYAEENKSSGGERPHLLLIDEPELCLHPNAVREACKVLYDLPAQGNWQVMVTTHSPAFVDLSRDNTTVVRVERDEGGKVIRGTTVFRPDVIKLSEDEKEELKLLNLCDPHLCEFLFGGKTVIVEGDTEYTAFRYVMRQSDNAEELRDVHVVRARGKATIRLVAKILNQFGAKYAVLHDSDCPTIERKKPKTDERETVRNGAWTSNLQILIEVSAGLRDASVRLISLVPNFEGAYFAGQLTDNSKPVNAWIRLRDDKAVQARVRSLLHALVDHNAPVPPECCEWSSEEELLAKWNEHRESSSNDH